MASIPRILTVDPNGTIPHQVRTAIDLMDRVMVQVDVPTADHAMSELDNSGFQVVISAWDPGGDMQGWELAAEIKRKNSQTAVILIADYDDTQLDEETLQASPFVYFHRPFDVTVFIRVMQAALNGDDIFEARMSAMFGGIREKQNAYGPVPQMNLERAKGILDSLLAELGAMAILLATRTGDVLLERGTVGQIKRDELAHALLPTINTNADLKDMVGGNATSVQFYDGEEYDVFVLTVGLHHFLCIIFDGTSGARQFGIVNRYGRRSAENLIALLGADAWLLRRQEAKAPKPQTNRPRPKKRATSEEEAIVELEPAVGLGETMPQRPQGLDEAIAARQQSLDAIPEDEFDIDSLFSNDVNSGDDDLFDLDGMEELARDLEDRQGKLTREQAIELGLINNNNQ